MARKRAPGFEAQREDILAAAAHLFSEQGFSATSMNQVAEACGVAKPTLYHYFLDKQELLAQICDSHAPQRNRRPRGRRQQCDSAGRWRKPGTFAREKNRGGPQAVAIAETGQRRGG